MRRFINKFLGETKKECSGSAKTAKERLQIVIAKDLSDNTLNGVLIQKIEAEILEVLKKYMDIREENIDIEVRSVLVDELITALNDGSLKEIFGAGTAAVINPIIGFSYKDTYYELPKIENSMALDIKEKLTNIQHKISEDNFGWTVKI